MSEEYLTIEGKVRELKGKSACRKIRRAGFLPANLLEKGKATSLELDPKFLARAYKTSKKFNLKLNGSVRLVHVQEVQVDAIKRTPVHVDLVYV